MFIVERMSSHAGARARMKKLLPYASPCVMEVTRVFLESDLLGGSIVYGTFIETVGQRNNGCYEEGEIVSDSNVWLD